MRHARNGGAGTVRRPRRRLALKLTLVILLSLVSPLAGCVALGEMMNSASASSSVPLNTSTTGCAYFDNCAVDVSGVDIRP